MRASVKQRLDSRWRDSPAAFVFTTGGQLDNKKIHLVSLCIAPIHPSLSTEFEVLRNAQKCSEMLSSELLK